MIYFYSKIFNGGIMNYTELLLDKYKTFEFLSENEALVYAQFFVKHQNDINQLHSLLEIIEHNNEMWSFHDLKYELKANNHTLAIHFNSITLTKEQVEKLIVSTLLILEEILPLGSVVDLKNVTDKEVENFRVVIVNRFIYQKQLGGYFEYVGVVYPLGKLSEETTISFTPSLIEKVVHRGYSDEQEEVFVKLMKIRLIIENDYISMSFLAEDQKQLLKKYIEEVKGEKYS